MNRDSIVARSPQVVARELPPPDGAVLLHLETGAYHGLNPVGFLIWGALDEERTVGAVVDVVREQVLDAPPSLEDDVIRFLAGASERNLVLIRDPRG